VKIPSAVSSTHPVQRPSGASEKIFEPHFRQALITVAIIKERDGESAKRENGDVVPSPLRRLAVSSSLLRPDYSDQMSELIFDVAGCSYGVGNLFPQ
jgi:hypothetical protein